ncbi:mannose-6-phosphate isomerase, class I [Sphaerisporangium melleum]|uniref:mannose-6-phosphate isomerase n=1 Tax=Sphaerisporangium melleum TaxID=321316 RepID=A0A917VSU4_9ACTN|nr:mannose-6-phosphate isomerase, class I [Sphaerisporangium melleum]GGL11117.1 mannose-6-phosphate isomerase, class I [Sphaerisporangium melleum]GII69067.1 mannose-6-phosphate isomerase, class I [Sphaerisporangium melleum]
MHLLTNPVKDYAWGSRTDIAELTGRPAPAPGPEAEMWLGAHPAGPSRPTGEDGRTLADLIAAEPSGLLGPATLDAFGERLPYLLKLIAVAQPLSLQVHPSAEQAVEGHARGVYGDPWPKPELVCALTPFTALAGFRPFEQAAMLIDRLGVPGLKDVVSLLEGGAVLRALETLLDRRQTAEQIVWAASAVHHPDYELVVRLARRYPGDPACLAPLLLRRHDLAPGQALFLGAGVLHCYLKGFGVEIMGGSDNVMRAGLTPKPLNVPELLRITDPHAVPLALEAGADGVFPTPSPEFRLRRLTATGEGGAVSPEGSLRLEGGVPRILLCTEGTATVGEVRLGRGESVFVPAAEPFVAVTTTGTVFVAEPGVPN